MAEENKGTFRAVFEFALSHITDIATLWYVVKGNKPPEGAPEWTKAADSSSGGEGKPEDEAGYAHFVSKIGTAPKYNDRSALQAYLRGWVNEAYQLHHPEPHVRERGRGLQQDWRVIIKQIAIDFGEQVAIDYLTTLAKKIRRYYHLEVYAKGKTLDTIKGKQKQACWEAACHQVNLDLLADGIHVPGEAEVPYTVQIKHFFKDRVFPFGQEAYVHFGAWKNFSARVAKTGWFAGGLVANDAKAKLHDLDQQAGRYVAGLKASDRKRRTHRQAFNENRGRGHGRAYSAGKAIPDARKSRTGPWKHFWYRFGAKINPFE